MTRDDRPPTYLPMPKGGWHEPPRRPRPDRGTEIAAAIMASTAACFTLFGFLFLNIEGGFGRLALGCGMIMAACAIGLAIIAHINRED